MTEHLYQLVRDGQPTAAIPYLDLAREAARRWATDLRKPVAIIDPTTGREVARYLPPGPLDPGPIDTHAGPLAE